MKKLAYKIIILLFVFVIISESTSTTPALAAEKNKYSVLIGDWDGNYILRDDLVVLSPKGDIMVKVKPLCDALDLDYDFTKDAYGLTQIRIYYYSYEVYQLHLTLGKRYYEASYDTGFTSYLTAKGDAPYKCYYDKKSKYTVMSASIMKELINYKYYNTSKSKDYKGMGYSGLFVYNRFNAIKSLPSVKKLVTSRTKYKVPIKEIGESYYAREAKAGEVAGLIGTYDKSKSIQENIDILNEYLMQCYGYDWIPYGGVFPPEKHFYLSEDNGKVRFSIEAWRHSYKSNEENYLINAALETMRYFCGKDMGNDLWLYFDSSIITDDDSPEDFNFEDTYNEKEDSGTFKYKDGEAIDYKWYDGGVSFWFYVD